jgi:hypothetical protein
MKATRSKKLSSKSNFRNIINKMKDIERCSDLKCKHIATSDQLQKQQDAIKMNCLQKFPKNNKASIFDKKENEMYKKRQECVHKEESKPEYRLLRNKLQKCVSTNCKKQINSLKNAY